MDDRNCDPPREATEPCAYCGAVPTWPVEWVRHDGETEVIWLCAPCDDRESVELDRELRGD